MASERLPAGPLPHVPELGAGVTGPGNEEFEVGRHSQAHAVPCVSHKHSLLLPGLNIPQSTAGRRGGCQRERPGQSCLPAPHPVSVLTTWCPLSWSQCCCRPGSGSRRDSLGEVRTVPWLQNHGPPASRGLPGTEERASHLYDQRAPG